MAARFLKTNLPPHLPDFWRSTTSQPSRLKGKHLYGSWSERLENWNKVHPEESITRWSQAIERDYTFRRGVLKTLNHAEQVYHRLRKAQAAKSKAKKTDGRIDPRKLAHAVVAEQERRALEKKRLRQERKVEVGQVRSEKRRRTSRPTEGCSSAGCGARAPCAGERAATTEERARRRQASDEGLEKARREMKRAIEEIELRKSKYLNHSSVHPLRTAGRLEQQGSHIPRLLHVNLSYDNRRFNTLANPRAPVPSSIRLEDSRAEELVARLKNHHETPKCPMVKRQPPNNKFLCTTTLCPPGPRRMFYADRMDMLPPSTSNSAVNPWDRQDGESSKAYYAPLRCTRMQATEDR